MTVQITDRVSKNGRVSILDLENNDKALKTGVDAAAVKADVDTALAGKISASEKNSNNGVVGIGANGEVTAGREKVLPITQVGNTLTIDMGSGASAFVVNLTASITTITIVNKPPSGVGDGFTIEVTPNGYGILWDTLVFKWPGNIPPILTTTAGKKDIFGAYTRDGGATFQMFNSGQNF